MKLSSRIVLSAGIFCSSFAAMAETHKDFSLHCTWEIDGMEHVTNATFRHLNDRNVLIDLDMSGRKCSSVSDPDLTFEGRQYVDTGCGGHFFSRKRDSNVWRMTVSLGGGLGSAKYQCQISE